MGHTSYPPESEEADGRFRTKDDQASRELLKSSLHGTKSPRPHLSAAAIRRHSDALLACL